MTPLAVPVDRVLDVEYGDVWTPEQVALVEVVVGAWNEFNVWPNFQFVAGKLRQAGVDDAVAVLRSFPILGQISPTTRYYCDVWFERTAPYPADDSKIALSVGGLAKHKSGEDLALAFVAILSYCAKQYDNAPLHPDKTVDVTVSADQVAVHLPGCPRGLLDRVGPVIDREHPVGIWSITPGGPDVPWNVGLRRDVVRYRNLTIETYFDLIRQDVKPLQASWPVASDADVIPSVVAADAIAEPEDTSVDRRSVFVVHGRNDALRKAMFDFLRSINLKPIEWTEAVSMTGHGSPYVGQVLDVAFDNAQAVVVLLTPDEIAYLQPQYGQGEFDAETQPAAQARPNVLFEAGMALGRNASRTVLVEVGQVRPFSDIAGRHVVRMSNSVTARQALAKRLETAGCAVDVGGTDWHETGDFSAPSEPGGGLPLGRRVPSAARLRPTLDFDAKYLDRGSSRLGKLQIINRGSETAHNVSLSVEEGAALDLTRTSLIERIPGGGKSVTIDVFSHLHLMGRQARSAFDLTVTAETESGETVTQNIFMDMNG